MNLEQGEILAANERYQHSDFRLAPRTPAPKRHLILLTCMDARLDLFRALGLEIGDAHILRNAGGRVTDDVIRSLIVSSRLLGTHELAIIHHTNCGLGGTSQEAIAEHTGIPDIEYLAFDDLEESVRTDVELVRGNELVSKILKTWGAIYDVDTGELKPVN